MISAAVQLLFASRDLWMKKLYRGKSQAKVINLFISKIFLFIDNHKNPVFVISAPLKK